LKRRGIHISEDGIYSTYFTNYDGVKGRYTLNCQIENAETAVVITPDKVANTFHMVISRTNILNVITTSLNEDNGPQSPRCCGSTTGNANVTTLSTGKFERKSSGGSFKVVKTPNRHDDIIPPSRILDLNVDKVQDDIDNNSVILSVSFTSPGDDFDEGIATYYQLRFVDSKMLNNSKVIFDDAIPIVEDDLISGSLNNPLNRSEIVVLEFNNSKMELPNTTYFLLGRAVDDSSNEGDLSNMARYCCR
jgi:hypothetical protein